MAHSVRVLSTGTYLPGEPVPFDEVEQVLGTLDDAPERLAWFVERSKPLLRDLLGIESYHYAIDRDSGETTETIAGMAAKAARDALAKADVDPNDVDLICYGGAHPDHMGCPPTGPVVQELLGIRRCAEFSVHSNCTASYKGIQIALDALASGRYRRALVLSSQINSAIFRARWFNQAAMDEDQASLRYFLCDGAGAMLLSRADTDADSGLFLEECYLESVGAEHPPHMYSRFRGHDPDLRRTWERGDHHLNQNFKQVSALAPGIFRDGLERMQQVFGLPLCRLRWFLANIPNKRLMDECAAVCRDDYGLAPEKLWSTLARRGYSGPPAVLISLDDLLRCHRLQPGEAVASLVTESSKWINAAFLLRQR
jgi:3-oxoacyl-[acyl-carrier-protein] synthase-3